MKVVDRSQFVKNLLEKFDRVRPPPSAAIQSVDNSLAAVMADWSDMGVAPCHLESRPRIVRQ